MLEKRLKSITGIKKGFCIIFIKKKTWSDELLVHYYVSGFSCQTRKLFSSAKLFEIHLRAAADADKSVDVELLN